MFLGEELIIKKGKWKKRRRIEEEKIVERLSVNRQDRERERENELNMYKE